MSPLFYSIVLSACYSSKWSRSLDFSTTILYEILLSSKRAGFYDLREESEWTRKCSLVSIHGFKLKLCTAITYVIQLPVMEQWCSWAELYLVNSFLPPPSARRDAERRNELSWRLATECLQNSSLVTHFYNYKDIDVPSLLRKIQFSAKTTMLFHVM
jgi:hypothetical protein